MAPEPTIAEERFAKLIAFWHGAKISHVHKGEAHTVASLRGIGWMPDHPAPQRYAERHWREYVDAARAVLDARI